MVDELDSIDLKEKFKKSGFIGKVGLVDAPKEKEGHFSLKTQNPEKTYDYNYEDHSSSLNDIMPNAVHTPIEEIQGYTDDELVDNMEDALTVLPPEHYRGMPLILIGEHVGISGQYYENYGDIITIIPDVTTRGLLKNYYAVPHEIGHHRQLAHRLGPRRQRGLTVRHSECACPCRRTWHGPYLPDRQ